MGSEAAGTGARRRLRVLVRQGRRPQVPLFVPVIAAAAAQIEALDLQDFLTNPTKLSKGLGMMHEITGTDGMVTFAARFEVAEAFGAALDWGSGLPALAAPADWSGAVDEAALQHVLSHPRLQTGLEATRRLRQTAPGDPLLAVLLTGPAALAVQLAGADPASAPALEGAGQITAALARAFGDAGVNLILLSEDPLPPGSPLHEEAWRSSLSTIANVARFFDALPAVLFRERGGVLASGFVREPVPGVVAGCFDGDPDRFPEVHCLDGPPASWALRRGPCSLVTTAVEVAADQDIPELREACLRLRHELAPGGDPA